MDRATIKTGYKLDRYDQRSELVAEIETAVKAVAAGFNAGKMDARTGNHMMALGQTLINWDERDANRKRAAEDAAKAKIKRDHNPEKVAETLVKSGLAAEANVWQKHGKTRIYFGRKNGYIDLVDGKWQSVGTNTEIWQACMSQAEYEDHERQVAYRNAPNSQTGFGKDIDLDQIEIPQRKVALND